MPPTLEEHDDNAAQLPSSFPLPSITITSVRGGGGLDPAYTKKISPECPKKLVQRLKQGLQK